MRLTALILIKVEENEKAVTETKEIFNNISSSIENLIIKISESTEENEKMARKKEEILNVIKGLTDIAEETSASTEEVSASIEEQLASIEEISLLSSNLKELADNLNKDINKFEIE